MKNAKKTILAAIFALAAPLAAAWDIVYDPTNTAQNAESTAQLADQYAKQLQQYALQLQQYQKQLQNMLNPETWGFGALTDTISSIQSLRDTMLNSFEQFKGLANYEDLLSQLMNMRSIADSDDGEGGSCAGSGGGCAGASAAGSGGCGFSPDLNAVKPTLQQAKEGIEKANKDVMKLIDDNFEWLKEFNERLKEVTEKAKTAQGAVQAIQYQSELISMLIELQVRVMQFDQTAIALGKIQGQLVTQQQQAITDAQAKRVEEMLKPGKLTESQQKVGTISSSIK